MRNYKNNSLVCNHWDATSSHIQVLHRRYLSNVKENSLTLLSGENVPSYSPYLIRSVIQTINNERLECVYTEKSMDTSFNA